VRVAITYNLKKEDPTKPHDYFSEYDKPSTVEAIASALESKGHSVSLLDVDEVDLISHFRSNDTDIVFNIAEGRNSQFRESEIPALLDLIGIPYTGSDAFSLAIALDKAMAKKILLSEGIATPRFQIFARGDEELNPKLNFPLIVKPNREGSSKGIGILSVADNRERLYEIIREVLQRYKQEALVEEFIEGKELTVGIMQNGKITVLPILEIDFSSARKSGEYFYSWRMKEYQGNTELGLTPTFYCPARLDRDTEEKVKDMAIKAHKSLGCRDISRIDMRLNKDNINYVLEINPLPGLDPEASNFTLMAKAAGFRYEDLIEAILLSGIERRDKNSSDPAAVLGTNYRGLN
jgi:D-alanine-D-alanine ligase